MKKIQAETLTDEQIEAVYCHFENGVQMPQVTTDKSDARYIEMKSSFTRTMGRYWKATADGLVAHNY